MSCQFIKKENKQLKKNYRPISLLPIREKICEKLMIDAIYEHLCANQLLTPNQSGFRPGDSTVNQLLSITHQIYSAFEEFPSRETRAVFLDTSKAFDKAIIYSNKGFSIQSSITTCFKRKKLVLVLYYCRCASRLRPWSLIFLNIH